MRIDGAACRTLAGFHDTVTAALGLPGWYGRNWDAFEECLADVAPSALTITRADELLADEDPGALAVLLDILQTRDDLTVTLLP